MATEAEITRLLEQLQQAPPSAGFKNIDRNTAGIRAILKYLNETRTTVTAGKISETMGVSTARVAVLLKKMVDKGLIEKTGDPSDARVVVVRLSEAGVKEAARIRQGIRNQIGLMIDRIGLERMLEFTAISKEVHAVMKAQEFDFER